MNSENMSNYDNRNDHKSILEKMSQQDQRLGEVLGECKKIREDMQGMVMQTRNEARADRENHREEINELHSRINEIKTTAENTAIRLEAQTKELEKVRSNLGKVALGLISSVISAVVAWLTIGK